MPVLAAPQASILEVFKSRQGEGVCVGDPQIFVRFGGCNLICDYCDTPESIPAKSGSPREISELLAQMETLRPESGPAVVSLTGGEPLVHVEFLEELLPRMRAAKYQIYLETNGSLPRALEKVVGLCDWVAMDFKPESAIGRDLWEAHRWFLEMSGSKASVKMVLTDKTAEAEFQRGVALVESVQLQTPLILQPATPWGVRGTIPLARLTCWWEWAARRLKDVRIIPQIHRLWEIA